MNRQRVMAPHSAPSAPEESTQTEIRKPLPDAVSIQIDI